MQSPVAHNFDAFMIILLERLSPKGRVSALGTVV
jgi:hypothetical protein